MKVEMTDKFYFSETKREYTQEGYLIVPAAISRPGTQIYRASELVPTIDMLPEHLRPEQTVVVYRPPEEVFKVESIDSFKNIAVTNNHPPEFLNSKNYKNFSVGVVLSDVASDTNYVQGTLKITDYDTINEVNEGKVDISAGYHSTIYFEEGETEEGEAYQAVQRDIIGNHVAIVARGRAGSEVKLADGLDDPSSQTEKRTEVGQTYTKGGEASETREESGRKVKRSTEEEEEELGFDGVPGSNTMSPFSDEEETSEEAPLEDKNIDVEEELKMKLQDAMNKIDELTQENAELSSKILDQAGLDNLVQDRIGIIDSCSKLMGDMDYLGKSNIDLKKEVLEAKMPSVNLNDKSNDYIDAAFDVLVSKLEDTVEGKHDEDVYGKDLAVEDEVINPDTGEEDIKETTKNVHEGENPDESGEEAKNDEEDKPVETKDSVSVLDSAFETEIKQDNISKTLTPYQEYCERSRNAWKRK